MNTNNCIEITLLEKHYKKALTNSLSEINLEIPQGDKFGILGPNGAGKTTLISILCGLIDSSSGHITYLDNKEEVQLKVFQQKMGYVPQDFAFYQELSPLQNLEYFGAMYQLSATQIKLQSQQILKILGLEKVKNKKVSTFSGGMKRRMNLAIGIIHNPSVLFLDEPTVGIDIQSKFAILNFLNELNKKGTTIIYTSHHLDEAQEFCDTIALLDNGKIIAKGETNSLLANNNVLNLKELLIKLTGASYRD